MIPWTVLDTATVPGGGILKLMRRGGEFSIKLDRTELMNSRVSGSEEALATLACARIAARPRPRLMIGGLGMGFTLRAALAALPPTAEVVVAELVPAVIAWARGPLAEIAGRGLDDPRVEVREADVAAAIGAAKAAFDAILLDVDNGPDGLSRPSNDRLYDAAGLAAAKAALRPGGVLAVWSAAPDRAFSGRLRHAGFTVEEARPRATRGGGARHVVWLAERPGTPKSVEPTGARRAAAPPPARATRTAATAAGKPDASPAGPGPRPSGAPRPARTPDEARDAGDRPLRRPSRRRGELKPAAPASSRRRPEG